MFVCCEYCVLSGRGLCDKLITRPEESHRLWCVVLCDIENFKNEEAMTRVGLQRHKIYINLNFGLLAFLYNGDDKYSLSVPNCVITESSINEVRSCTKEFIYQTSGLRSIVTFSYSTDKPSNHNPKPVAM
jgi:hypothetical protein